MRKQSRAPKISATRFALRSVTFASRSCSRRRLQWLEKPWGEGEDETGCGHDAADNDVTDAVGEEEAWWVSTFKEGRVDVSLGSAETPERRAKYVPTGTPAFESGRDAWPDGSDNEVVGLCVDEFMRTKPAEQEETTIEPPDDDTPEMTCRTKTCPWSQRSLPRKILQSSGARYTMTPTSAQEWS